MTGRYTSSATARTYPPVGWASPPPPARRRPLGLTISTSGVVAAAALGELLLARQRRHELRRGDGVGEHRVVLADRVVVLLDRGRRDAVGQREDVEALLVRRAHRRLHAAVGEETAERDVADALAAQDEVEVGAREGVQAALALDDDVPLLGREVLDDRGAPGALDERVALDDAGEDAVRRGADLAVALRE